MKVRLSWWLRKRASPQAGNRARKPVQRAQWRDIVLECRPECLRVPRLRDSQLLLCNISIAALHFNCAFMEFGFTIISLISVWICRFSWFENYGSQADFFLFIFKPCTDIVGYYVQYRSHFGSRYKSRRCVLRSPFRVLTSP